MDSRSLSVVAEGGLVVKHTDIDGTVAEERRTAAGCSGIVAGATGCSAAAAVAVAVAAAAAARSSSSKSFQAKGRFLVRMHKDQKVHWCYVPRSRDTHQVGIGSYSWPYSRWHTLVDYTATVEDVVVPTVSTVAVDIGHSRRHARHTIGCAVIDSLLDIRLAIVASVLLLAETARMLADLGTEVAVVRIAHCMTHFAQAVGTDCKDRCRSKMETVVVVEGVVLAVAQTADTILLVGTTSFTMRKTIDGVSDLLMRVR